jgi:predicted lipoprotein with Yx(FWY)xxD motif
MHVKRSIAAAVLSVAVPGVLLGAGAGASIARSAGDPVANAAKTATVRLGATSLGKVLVAGSGGRTLYLSIQDAKNKSMCTGQCAVVWPPLLTSGKPSAGKGVSAAKLGEIKRGRSHQVTYAGHPLYTFDSDSAAGQTSGEGDNGFYVVSPSGKAIK